MNWYKKAKKAVCKGWVGVNLDKNISKKIQDWGKENIPSSILTDDGRETNTHVTVLYGICTEIGEVVKGTLSKEKKAKAKLGKIGCFTNNDDFDVVIVKVESKDLEKLHKRIKEDLNVSLTHDTYKPHCTIAYVKKGEARKYAGNDIFEGKEVTFNEAVFKSTENGKETIIPLRG
jgi:2'-5' RNA ligase